MPTYLTKRRVTETINFKPKANFAAELGVIKAGDEWFAPFHDDPSGGTTYVKCNTNDTFERTGTLVDIEGVETFIPKTGWRWSGPAGSATDASKMRIRAVALAKTEPGENMKDPWGEPLWNDDGTRLVRPAIGQQDVDPWSGAPLVEPATGEPILVPDPNAPDPDPSGADPSGVDPSGADPSGA